MSALEHLTSTAGCLSQITALAGEQRYQMDNDFRVRVGLENHPFTTEFLAQFEVVFNDTIVNDDVLAVHTDVRMRVSLTWLAVRRPACMSNACMTIERLLTYGTFQIFEFAHVTAE